VPDDEPTLYISKPDHVGADEWINCFGAYTAALALYRRALVAIGDRINAGLAATDEQHRAEETAHDILVAARKALLALHGAAP
jgi:hypothetical protein